MVANYTEACSPCFGAEVQAARKEVHQLPLAADDILERVVGEEQSFTGLRVALMRVISAQEWVGRAINLHTLLGSSSEAIPDVEILVMFIKDDEGRAMSSGVVGFVNLPVLCTWEEKHPDVVQHRVGHV
ncbi:hypothetical protein TRAPUB_3374 [Trametes pubescens]|uniref:Uncharacterized protein n=1 Tax=Trametes pubescens TaxID=154538 RepID=A0A1M2VDX7_TRAPU|nr:hypothetical protein TRAPUB_3374 [Trametes pubescens]